MCFVTLSARIVAAATRVAPPVTEYLTLNASMTLASVETASSSAMECAKKVRYNTIIAYRLFGKKSVMLKV